MYAALTSQTQKLRPKRLKASGFGLECLRLEVLGFQCFRFAFNGL